MACLPAARRCVSRMRSCWSKSGNQCRRSSTIPVWASTCLSPTACGASSRGGREQVLTSTDAEAGIAGHLFLPTCRRCTRACKRIDRQCLPRRGFYPCFLKTVPTLFRCSRFLKVIGLLRDITREACLLKVEQRIRNCRASNHYCAGHFHSIKAISVIFLSVNEAPVNMCVGSVRLRLANI
jgi:hypothetical protein